MTDLLLGANQLCWAARRCGKRFSESDIAAFRTFYDAIVGAGEALHPEVELLVWKGGRAKQSVACNLLRRFRTHTDAMLLFIRDLAVPFTNDVAERAVRMPKEKQKISVCLRTVKGPAIYASSDPASTHYASKATVCSSRYNAPSPAILSSPRHSH